MPATLAPLRCTMYSWIFRHRQRLEAIYGRPGHGLGPRRLPRPEERGARTQGEGPPRLAIIELIPHARRRPAA